MGGRSEGSWVHGAGGQEINDSVFPPRDTGSAGASGSEEPENSCGCGSDLTQIMENLTSGSGGQGTLYESVR